MNVANVTITSVANSAAVSTFQGPAAVSFDLNTIAASFMLPTVHVDESMEGALNKFTQCSASNSFFSGVILKVQYLGNKVGQDLGLYLGKPSVLTSDGGKLSSNSRNELLKFAHVNAPKAANIADKEFMKAIMSNPELQGHQKIATVETAITVDPTQSAEFQEKQKLSQLAHQLVLMEKAGDIAKDASQIFEKAKPILQAMTEDSLFLDRMQQMDKVTEFIGAFHARIFGPLSQLMVEAAKIDCEVADLFESCKGTWGLESPVTCNPGDVQMAGKAAGEMDKMFTTFQRIIARVQDRMSQVDMKDPDNFPTLAIGALEIYLDEMSKMGGRPMSAEDKAYMRKMFAGLKECLSDLKFPQRNETKTEERPSGDDRRKLIEGVHENFKKEQAAPAFKNKFQHVADDVKEVSADESDATKNSIDTASAVDGSDETFGLTTTEKTPPVSKGDSDEVENLTDEL